MLCSLLTQSQKSLNVFCSLEVRNTFLILTYFDKNIKNVFHVARFHTETLFSFDLPLNFLNPCWLGISCTFVSPCLVCSGELKESLPFPELLGMIPVALKTIVKQNTNNVFEVVQFHTVTLFSFDFPSNFLMALLAKHDVACLFFLA